MQTTITDHLLSCDEIYIIKNGIQTQIDHNLINSQLQKLTKNSYFSPAFGVSIHNETIKALKQGTWIEFRFPTQQTYAEMPFSKLLIQMQPDMYGFNIIRFNNGEYSGRCYYLNLNVSSTDFYNFINLLV